MFKKISLIGIICLGLLFISSCAGNNGRPMENCQNGEHEHLEWVVIEDSTCSTLGRKEQQCSKCHAVLTTAIIEYKPHTEKVISGKDATCTTEGYTEQKVCSICNQVLEASTSIPAINHNYTIDTELSTDTKMVYRCHNCNDTYEKEVTVENPCQNGHTSGEWITTKESTCTEYGSAHKLCTICEVETEVKTLPLSSHKEEKVLGFEATCNDIGLSDGIKCSVCEKTIVEQTIIQALGHDYKIINTVEPTEDVDGYIEYRCDKCSDSYQKVLPATGSFDEASPVSIYLKNNDTSVINNNGGVSINSNEIKITLAGEYDIYGELSEGSIVVSVSDTSDVILNLRGITLTSSVTNPIYIEAGNKVEISAKSETINYIYDKRAATTTDVVGGAIYSLIDTEIKGKGTLVVTSTYNNGIASTKDLEIKNLTLEVNAPNNAIKGNDSITIESGTIKAISSSGDALKTENSDISTKGNQRGTITILDGTLDLYAACDGIDAAYDCIISGGKINIYTESYSSYSGDVTETASSTMYLRISSRASALNSISKYSAMFITEANETKWVNGTYTSANGKKYYKFDVPSGVNYVKFFAYNASQTQSQSSSYAYASDQHAISPSYDTYYVNSVSSTRMSGSWENFSSPSGGMGGPGGPGGGMMEGNPNSSTYSCKGIKADNSITINNGTINIKSHDDGIHTNSDVLLDNGSYGIASLTISGGNITVYSDDDGLHADGNLTINGGNVVISNSYEGIEGNNIYFKAGTVQMKALDDAINAKTTLYFQGSTVYLDAGGDGIDSNGSIYMTSGVVLALGPTNGGNGVIDYGDRNASFSFSGGLLVAVGCSGMNAKPTASSGNTVSATTKTAPSVNSYLTITSNGNVVAVMKVTKSNQNYQVLAYNNTTYPSTSISVTTSTSVTLTNGLYYVK